MSFQPINRSAVAVFVFSLITLLASPAAFSQSDAVATMAGIVADMQHFPSDGQKQTLSAIANDESNSEATRAIAMAIHNIQHKAQPDDVAALKKVESSGAASGAEKELASIVLGFHHMAGDKAKKQLNMLASQ